MTKWEYKSVLVNRTGSHEDFSYNWTYTPWEMLGTGQAGNQPIEAGLRELGGEGWELVGVLPTDLWSEGTRAPAASHGIRTISCTFFFKRPAGEEE